MSYSGVLRASLIRPDYERPIESIQDIVKSGLSWKIVLYGSTYETLLKNNPDEFYVRFWKEKETISYNEFPYQTVRTNVHT